MTQNVETMIVAWSILIGVLLTLMALSSSLLKRIPLSGAVIYLFVGLALSEAGLQLLMPRPIEQAPILERVAECALIVSLFSAGLKLRLPLRDERWRVSLQLATVTMLITIALLTALGIVLGLSVGAAILLGAILAPTDPVLASDVQVENAGDTDRLRFSLTGESGLNDGTAFPFVILGLTILHAHSPTEVGRWFAAEVLWSTGAGIAVGGLWGSIVGRLVLYLRTQQKEAVGLDEFLALGLIALAYGCALWLHASTFLAVFCAGLAMTRATRMQRANTRLPEYELDKLHELATEPEHAGALMMRAVLGFNQQLERVAEVTVVVLVGALLPFVNISLPVVVLIAALILILRPFAVQLSLIPIRGLSEKANIGRSQRWLISWFGVRGIGSIYYLFFSINHGLSTSLTIFFTSVVVGAVATSIVVHGISVTPLMKHYENRSKANLKP
jgi:NhaP-type Na+/H+ or K+/H+ antiporter